MMARLMCRFSARFAAIIIASLVWSGAVAASESQISPRNEARVFFFGNSLIHHLTDSDTTTVPHWLALLAKADAKSFAAEGRWGFPRDFGKQLPPPANWSFKAVPRAWDHYTQTFREGRFDAIVLTPENFIQYDPVDRPYQGDNPDGSSPLDATLSVLDWVEANTDSPRIMIYEGWADLHPFSQTFPPSAEQMSNYYAHAGAGYHDWFRSYVESLRTERPQMNVTLIPVGSVMAKLMTGDLLSDIETEAFYSDRSPHGTATTYLLAAMITYSALYGVAPPSGVALTPDIDARFGERYDQVAAAVWAETKVSAGEEK